jgi:hypothetical protein
MNDEQSVLFMREFIRAVLTVLVGLAWASLILVLMGG